MFQRSFSQAQADFQLNMAKHSGDAAKIDDFVKANHSNISVLKGSEQLTDAQIERFNREGKFVVGIGDQLIKIPVREIFDANISEEFDRAYSSGMLMSVAYLAIPETKRDAFVDALDSMERSDHNVHRSSDFVVIELPPATGAEMDIFVAKEDPSYQSKIIDLAQGNFGSGQVLKELLAEGTEVFDRVAGNLGKGAQIWITYKDECGEDLQKLIANYAK